MSPLVQRTLSATLVVCALTLTACGTADVKVTGSLSGNDDFVKVARTSQALTADSGTDGYASAGNENFYLAINKSQLAQKWFMSAYLTQWHPSEAGQAARSLGTRVVTFKVQNGKLYVFDATDGTKWSDALDPQLVVEAYPIVTDFAPFNALAGASNYVLIDPSAGLNRFEMMGDSFAASYQARFQVELSYLQRFRTLTDGVSYEQVFTGYSEVPGPGILGWDQPFRGSGTMSISLRRYAEGAGFVASEKPVNNHYFGSGTVQYVPNEPRVKQNVVKWNIKPGMQPIPWRITKTIERLKADPRLAGIDIEGAMTRGVTGWNDAFGFPVFTVVASTATDSFGDDDKNFIVVDTNPGLGMAFANWRENPNTGEVRGASVYFSSTFIESALVSAGDAGLIDAGQPVVVDAGQPIVDAGTPSVPCAPQLVISQVFGGGSATAFKNQDFVVIHNRSSDPVFLTGNSLQYGSATGTAAWQVIPLTGVVPPNGSYLVGFALSTGGTAIPTPDQSSGINLAGASGKLALVAGTTALTGACTLTNVIDAVGYGTTNCSELRAAPAGVATASVIRRDLIGCVDTNDNGADFISSATEPSNTASAAATACVCTAPVSPIAPAPSTAVSTDGGVQLANPEQPVRPTLRWSAMTEQALCAYEAPKAVIPAGMSRKDFLEGYITEVILHEVGHTLGLRHNFKGSLEGGTSVMDYNAEGDALRLTRPGTYDVAAVRFLYGLSPTEPTQAFCTDENTLTDASCARFDTGTAPLTTDLAPRYQAMMRVALTGATQVQYRDIFPITRYVRGAPTEAQRLEAFNALIGDTAPPLKPEVLALNANAGAYANFYNAVLLLNLFVDPAPYRDEIAVDPLLNDPAFRARAIEVAKNSLMGSDGQRTLQTMRVMVNVLKAMQHDDALVALNQARATFAANRAAYPANVQPLIDDLIRRIDVATSPYFY